MNQNEFTWTQIFWIWIAGIAGGLTALVILELITRILT